MSRYSTVRPYSWQRSGRWPSSLDRQLEAMVRCSPQAWHGNGVESGCLPANFTTKAKTTHCTDCYEYGEEVSERESSLLLLSDGRTDGRTDGRHKKPSLVLFCDVFATCAFAAPPPPPSVQFASLNDAEIAILYLAVVAGHCLTEQSRERSSVRTPPAKAATTTIALQRTKGSKEEEERIEWLRQRQTIQIPR